MVSYIPEDQTSAAKRGPANVKRIFLIGAALVFFTGCTATGLSPEDEAKQVVEMQGFTDVKITGYDFFACAKSDTFRTGFEATSPTGKRIKGVVCSEALKGATMRVTGFVKTEGKTSASEAAP